MPNVLSPAQKISDMMKREQSENVGKNTRNLRKRQTDSKSAKEPQVKLPRLSEKTTKADKVSASTQSRRRSAPVKTYKEMSEEEEEKEEVKAPETSSDYEDETVRPRHRNSQNRISRRKPARRSQPGNSKTKLDDGMAASEGETGTGPNKRHKASAAKKEPVRRQRKTPGKKGDTASRSKQSSSRVKSKDEDGEPVKQEPSLDMKSDSKLELSSQPSTSCAGVGEDMSSTDDDGDWEEVAELPSGSPVKQEVKVTVDNPNVKKKKKGFDWAAYARRLWKRYQKSLHECVHKLHEFVRYFPYLVQSVHEPWLDRCSSLGCFRVNDVCNSGLLRALTLSLNVKVNLKGKQCNVSKIRDLVDTMKSRFSLDPEGQEPESINTDLLLDNLTDCFQRQQVSCRSYLSLALIGMMRGQGLSVRLCVAWYPIPFRQSEYERNIRKARFQEGKLRQSEADDKLTSKKGKKAKASSPQSTPENRQPQIWFEVYAQAEQKWLIFDSTGSLCDDHKPIGDVLNKPITYIICIDNAGKVKDVTQKYDINWMISTRKLRVENDWWDELLEPYHVRESKKTRLEDEQIQNQLEQMPFPTSIGGFKGHPLYALERHLLKFEALYPPSAVPLGFTKTKEPIYSRSCVQTLHSRETWLKDAKQVKMGEEPYKYVKPRPKMKDKTKVTEATLPVFGYWQTEEYVPPTAENGKVPRNAYGNVELFQPQMLPVGCVHIPINGIGKLARRMNIDCAQAMIGWEAHSGYSCPQFDGWIVCKEYKAELLAAWKDYEAEQEQRAQEKREKKIYGNWKTLIKGLLIRERLRNRYGKDSF